MTKMITLSKYVLIFASAMMAPMLSSCEGPEGPMGPSGYDGKDGNANVGVAIYDVAPENWSGGLDGYEASLTITELTTAIYESGAVLVYRLWDESSDKKYFTMLPYTWINNNITEYMDYDALVGKLVVRLRWVDNGTNNTAKPTENFAFKVVIIEGYKLDALNNVVNTANLKDVENFVRNNRSFAIKECTVSK